MKASTLTVLIASWNGWTKLRTCLRSIYAGHRVPTQIIVIDNHSNDGTPERLREQFPQVELHENAANFGHTRAINQGFALARGEYVLVLDDDTELAVDCIELLVGFLEANPGAALAGPRMFNSDGTLQESARNFPSVLSGLFGRQSLLTRLWPNNRISGKYLAREFLQAREPFEVEQLSGACMMLRHSVLDQIGPWDGRYIGYWVDTDWCRSAKQRSLGVYCVPAAHVTHHESNARGKRKSAHRIWIFHRGAYQYFTKWHCWGVWDPRSILAGTMLTARAACQIGTNQVLHSKRSVEEPVVEIKPVRPELQGSEE
jgi:N-acetylglucosaminyl-diphospho-decaprenol L-rhamnosyltransferase